MLKTRSKTKVDSAAVVSVSPNVIEDVCIPLTEFEMIVKGKPIVLCIPKPNLTRAIMDGKGKAVVVSSSFVDLSKKYEANEVATHINFGSQLRTKSNRIEVDGVEDALRSKSSTDPLPNNKKRNCLSKGSSKEYVMPEDFINQQRAYFKEIDEYELEVEEVE